MDLSKKYQKIYKYSKGICTRINESQNLHTEFQTYKFPLQNLQLCIDDTLLAIYDVSLRKLAEISQQSIISKYCKFGEKQSPIQRKDLQNNQVMLQQRGRKLLTTPGGARSQVSYSMRNSSVVRQDKLLVMNGVGLSLRGSAFLQDIDSRDETKNKFATMAAQIDAELDEAIFDEQHHDQSPMRASRKLQLDSEDNSRSLLNTVPAPFKNRFSSYKNSKNSSDEKLKLTRLKLSPRISKPGLAKQANKNELNREEDYYDQEEQESSEYEQEDDESDNNPYEEGHGYQNIFKRKLPSIVTQQQSYQITQGHIGSFVQSQLQHQLESQPYSQSQLTKGG